MPRYAPPDQRACSLLVGAGGYGVAAIRLLPHPADGGDGPTGGTCRRRPAPELLWSEIEDLREPLLNVPLACAEGCHGELRIALGKRAAGEFMPEERELLEALGRSLGFAARALRERAQKRQSDEQLRQLSRPRVEFQRRHDHLVDPARPPHRLCQSGLRAHHRL